MKTTKETIFEFIQKELMTNETCKDGISTIMIAQQYQLQRSNVSALLNELVKEGKLEKTNTRPVLYTLKQKEDTVQIRFDHFLKSEKSVVSTVPVGLIPAELNKISIRPCCCKILFTMSRTSSSLVTSQG